MNSLGYSPETAAAAFDPPLSDNSIRKAVKTGALAVYQIGTHAVILREDLAAWVRTFPQKKYKPQRNSNDG